MQSRIGPTEMAAGQPLTSSRTEPPPILAKWLGGPRLGACLKLAFFVAYVVAGGLGHGLAIIPGVAITFWPPAGLLAGVLLKSKRRSWPGWLLTACAAELTCNALWFHNAIAFALVYFFANSLEATLTAVLAAAFCSTRHVFESVKATVVTILIGACVSPLAGALIIASTDAWIGKHEFHVAFPLAWLGDASGFLAVAPLTIVMINEWQQRKRFSVQRHLEALAVFVLLALAYTAALSDYLPTLYFVLPLVLWASVRFQLSGAAIALTILLLETAAIASHPLPDASAEHLRERTVYIQCFLGITATSALVMGALSLQHKNALSNLADLNSNLEERVQVRTAELVESESRFRQMANNSPVMIWVTDTNGQCNFLSNSWFAFTGEDRRTLSGLDWLRALHDDDRRRVEEELRRAMSARAEFKIEYLLRRKAGDSCWVLDSGSPRFSEQGEFLGYIGTVLDISDRKRIEQGFRDADVRKNQFLATLAHELRNPLATLQNSVQLLALSQEPRNDVPSITPIMQRQLHRMIRMVDDLLDVNRIALGKLLIKSSTVELHAVIREAAEACRSIISEQDHDLIIDLPSASPVVDIDSSRITQVFVNLLTNAAKYTPKGGTIVVACTADDSHALVTITDNGSGIPAHLVDRVFDMFTQVDGQAADVSRGGLGIGLALSKAIVELHAGSITAHSNPDKHGTQFRVQLPLAASHLALDREQPSDTLASFSAQRILVVDDNVDTAKSLALICRLLKHEVCMANSGLEAIRLAESFQPTLVILDLGMPEMDGCDTCSRMRQTPWSSRAVFVALTGWGQAEDRSRSQAAGFDHHVVKPIDMATLQQLIATCQPLELSGQ